MSSGVLGSLGALTRDDALDGVLAIGQLGGEPIVRSAEQSNVESVVGATFPARCDVVVLEPCPVLATCSVGALPGAPSAIAIENGTADVARDVAGLVVLQNWRGSRGH